MDEIAKKMAELADKLGPNVVAAARAAAQAEAYSTLMGGVLFLFAAAILGSVAFWCFKKGHKTSDEAWYIGVLAFGALSGMCTIAGLWHVVDPWIWITINHPDAWIAHRVLHL